MLKALVVFAVRSTLAPGGPTSVADNEVMDDISRTELVEAARKIFDGGEDADAVLAFLRQHGLDFISCVKVIRELRSVGLGEAKLIVHRSPSFEPGRGQREQFWAALHEGAGAFENDGGEAS